MKIKKIAAVFAASVLVLSSTSCGLVSVHRIDAPPREENRENSVTEVEKTEQRVYSAEKSSEKRRSGAVSLIKEKCADTYSGEIVFAAECDGGDIFSDETVTAIDKLTVTRNALVEETLDVKLVIHRMSEEEMLENAKRQKKAGEVYDDILIIDSDKLMKYSPKGLLYDLTKIDGFDLSGEFFDQYSADGSSLGSGVFAVIGDASFMPEDYFVVFFDNGVLSSAGIARETIFSAVERGEWTWDMLLGYDAMLNGVNIATPFSAPQLADAVYKSAGYDYLLKSKNKISPAFDTKTVLKFGELFTRISESGLKTSSYSAVDDFVSGNTSFLIHKLSAIEKISASTSDYGIVPLPVGAVGGEYRTTMPRTAPMFSISVNSDSKKAASDVITALNAATAPIIYEGYTEYLLNDFLGEPDSARMLGTVFASSVYDPSYILGAEYKEVAAAAYDFVYKCRTTDEKTLEKQYKTAVSAMNKAVEKAAKVKK